jgi:hypothetical protein
MTTEHTFQLQFRHSHWPEGSWWRYGPKCSTKEAAKDHTTGVTDAAGKPVQFWRIIEEKQETTYHEIV